MKAKFLAIGCAILFLSSCAYPLTQMSVDAKSISKPHTVVGIVEASDWSWPFADIAKGNVLGELSEKARAMGADDIVNVKVANNCWWAFLLHCKSKAVGTAIKYE